MSPPRQIATSKKKKIIHREASPNSKLVDVPPPLKPLNKGIFVSMETQAIEQTFPFDKNKGLMELRRILIFSKRIQGPELEQVGIMNK